MSASLSTGYPFFIVDVFAEQKYRGNQLGVFPDAGGFSDGQMQRFAKEMNYSETTFILSREPREEGYDVRIFTPDREVPFAGHPTLGTAFIIQQTLIAKPVEEVILNLKVGPIPVDFTYDRETPETLMMTQNKPVFGPNVDAQGMSDALGLQVDDLDDNFPVQQVSTGLAFVIVPVKTLEGLRRIRVKVERSLELVENLDAKAILAFCPQTHQEQNDLSARVFAHYYGVPEDPATGSANGCLAGYLVKHRYFGDNWIDIRVEQGQEIGRPSLLLLKAQENGDDIEVRVGGRVILVARGEFVGDGRIR
jgi:trans-2,3-dihydro-3-hydroxyanthranilate isomerase